VVTQWDKVRRGIKGLIPMPKAKYAPHHHPLQIVKINPVIISTYPNHYIFFNTLALKKKKKKKRKRKRILITEK
jgi:hypothetical protein